MQILTLYAITAFVFLAADAIMLRTFMKPLFEKHLGDWLLEPIRIGPAAAFYLVYVAGVLWLISWPALRDDVPTMALINGAILGALAYGTYEFTNYATLSRWSMQQVMVDTTWGAVLTGVSAWAGVQITRAIFG